MTTTSEATAATAGSAEPIAVVRRLVEEGWNGGSIAPVADIVDEDYDSNDGGFYAVGSDEPSGLRRLEGVEAAAKHLDRYTEQWCDLRFALERTIPDGDDVVALWTATGASRTRTFVDRAGRDRPVPLDERMLTITTVVGGKVTRHDLYWPRA